MGVKTPAAGTITFEITSLQMAVRRILIISCTLKQWRRTEFESGGTGPARSAGKKFGRALHFFGSKSTISRFAERFRDGQYSLVSFLFAVLILTVPPCPAICKVGDVPPRALLSRRHCLKSIISVIGIDYSFFIDKIAHLGEN